MSKEEIRRTLADAGACAVGFAAAGEVEREACEAFDRWLDAGLHAGMDYMRNHGAIRRDPRLLLPGARTVISLAFRYPQAPVDGSCLFASYSLGFDYHDVLRNRLREALAQLPEEGEYRICIDSAPIAERYWARKAGIGFIADNGALTVPGIGNRVFLAEIVTTLEIDPDREYPLARGCGSCGACRRACPAGALQRTQEAPGEERALQPARKPMSVIDCHRCLSYLTIEHRGEWEDPRHLEALAEAKRKGSLPIFGCDRCIQICPHNRGAAKGEKGEKGERGILPELLPREEIAGLTAADCLALSQDEFSRLFRGSAVKRAKLAGLQRNARLICLELKF